MTDDLMMPVHVHTLVLDAPLMVAGAPLDYEGLPWFDGTRDHNGSVPNLAGSIADAPSRRIRYGCRQVFICIGRCPTG